MELVYLWVEDYKNIHRQGFNFSPRFECKFYDEYKTYTDENGKEQKRLKENCELIICDKKENKSLDKKNKKCKPCEDNSYIENFFGENINVTAIVGKNGSGKTNILEIINNNQFIFLLYLIDNKLHIYKTMDNIIVNSNVYNLILVNSFSKKLFLPTFDYKIIDYIEEDTFRKTNNYGETHNILLNKKEMCIFTDENIRKQIYMIVNSKNIFNGIINKNIYIDFAYYKFGNANYISIEHPLYNDDEYLNNLELEDYLYLGIFDFLFIILNQDEGFDEDKYDSFINKFLHKNKHINEPKILFKLFGDILVEKNYLETYKQIKDFFTYTKNQFKHLNKITTNSPFNSDINQCYLIELNNDNLKYIKSYFNLVKEGIGKINLIDFAWENNHSSGEQSFLNSFSILYWNLKKENLNIISIDEFDQNIHPNWQKYYLKILIEFLDLNFKFKDIHILISTHSPFLLSDIPKHNIIFLDKDENGNCKVVDGLKDKKQTFGANIHTLLSDSFFMKDGLIGEFAKSKIEEVIKILNKKRISKRDLLYCKDIINIIGEPILKRTLEEKLNSKLYPQETKLDKLKREKEELEKQIEKLEDNEED